MSLLYPTPGYKGGLKSSSGQLSIKRFGFFRRFYTQFILEDVAAHPELSYDCSAISKRGISTHTQAISFLNERVGFQNSATRFKCFFGLACIKVKSCQAQYGSLIQVLKPQSFRLCPLGFDICQISALSQIDGGFQEPNTLCGVICFVSLFNEMVEILDIVFVINSVIESVTLIFKQNCFLPNRMPEPIDTGLETHLETS